jgi:hypothetical protein
MPGIPRDVAEHSLDVRAGARPVKQSLRRFDEEERRAIGEEIHKLMAAGFIKEAKGVELNPEKCVFGVPRGMFLGFVVSKRGIEANPEKITTIAQHPEPLLGTPGGLHAPLGRAACHRQSSEARNVQAGQQPRRGLQQRLEHPTATSLLPLRCFQVVRIPRSHASFSRQGRVSLASVEPDPPLGAKKGGTPLRQDWGTPLRPKFSTKKAFAFPRLCRKQDPRSECGCM